jgi:hypothetical protein
VTLATSFTIDVNVTDGATHQVALYTIDWDLLNRTERIDVLNASGSSLSVYRGIVGGHRQ